MNNKLIANVKLVALIFILGMLFITGCQKDYGDDKSSNLDNEETELRHEQIDLALLYDPCKRRPNITICMDECMIETPWECAINGAIDAYNDLPRQTLSMNFNVIDCDDDPDITITCGDLVGATAQSTIRTADNPTTTITLDNATPTNWPCVINPNATCCQLQRTVMHEIGHSLGFGHTVGINGLATTLIPGTDPTDVNSVFIGGEIRNFCDDICEFSDGDMFALQTLYGFGCNCVEDPDECDCPAEFPSDLCACEETTDCNCPGVENPQFEISYNGPVCMGDVVTFTANPIPSGQDLSIISWSIPNGGLMMMSSFGDHAVVEAHDPGTFQICVRVENSCGNQAQQCETVVVQPESVCGGPRDIPNPK